MCEKQRSTNILNFWNVKKCTCKEQGEIVMLHKHASLSVFFTRYLCDYLFKEEEKEVYYLDDSFAKFFLQRLSTREEEKIICWVDNGKIYEQNGWFFEELCNQGIFVYILCEQ